MTNHAVDAATIVDHLQKHRRIAHVSGPHTFLHEEERIRGVRERAAGYGIDVVHHEADYALDSGHDAVMSLLAAPAGPPVTAMVFGNDLMSMGGLLALRDLGLHCPEDVAVVSWDDSLHCRLASPSVTALSRNPGLQGQVAAELLLSLLDSGEARTRTMPPGHLMVRASTTVA
jgi:DNA-binding LacI/PurR family transcriptional regulator